MLRHFTTHSYDSLAKGPVLVALGGVHGDERCGPEAVRRVMEALGTGALRLIKGKLIVVPVCNPRAYHENVRFVERNLNRHLYPKENPQAYEDFIDPALCAVLDQADAVLDLHSYFSPGKAFLFLDTVRKEEADYALSLGVSDVVSGWAEAYGASAPVGSREHIGTTEYARQRGAIAVTLECGQHHNPDAPDIGFEAVLRALAHLGISDPACACYRAVSRAEAPRSVRMKSVFYKTPGGRLARPFVHFDFVKEGEPLAYSAEGGVTSAPCDGYIVLPKDVETAGAEWFYFGVAAPLPV